MKFVTTRTCALEEYSAGLGSLSKERSPSGAKVHAIAVSTTTSTHSSSACPVCKTRHFFSACPTFVCNSPTKRRELVKQYKRCFHCLSNKHTSRDCTSKFSCRLCSQKHHTMLHTSADDTATATVSESPPAAAVTTTSSEKLSEIQALSTAAIARAPSSVLLATAQVSVRASSGRSLVVRALINQGLEMTFISESVAQMIGAHHQNINVSVSAVGGLRTATVKHSTQISLSPRDARTPTVVTTALIMRCLTTYAPKRTIDISSFAHLRGLYLADPDFTRANPIQIIIGADLYGEILLDEILKGQAEEPLAQRTIFGWIVSGSLGARIARPMISTDTTRAFHNITVHNCFPSKSLDNELRKFWEIEETPRQKIH